MNAIADEFQDRVGSVFVYTHEAHPGEHYPHHETIDRKLAHARDLRDRLRVARPVLVDDLSGRCHQTFGSMPNMTWILGAGGYPVYKADWTDPASVRNALGYFLEANRRRRAGGRMVPFRVERLDLRDADRTAFFAGLERSGPKAVAEFRAFIATEPPG